jgi:signal transduction histidine kinase
LGIRARLLLLAIGIAVPLVLVGALDLRSMWRLSRAQLDDSVKQQVDLASVALERWLDDQRKALTAIAALTADNDTRSTTIRENLESVLTTRLFWLDLRITNAAGTTIMAQPSRKNVLPSGLTDYLDSEMRERKSWVVITDRTLNDERPIVIIAVPVEEGGAVIARIDGAAINQLFDSIELSQQAVISVLDSDGRILYRRLGAESTTEADVSWAPLSSALRDKRTHVVELTSPVDGVERVYGIAHLKDAGLVTLMGIPSVKLYEPARSRLRRYALVGLMGLLFAISAALVIERSIVVPMQRLRTTAQRLGKGDLSARVPTKESGEIRDLADSFNAMAERIKEREDRLKELDRLKSDFVSSVSHELKTPLTTIKIMSHLLQGLQLTDEERIEYAKTITTECDRQIDFVGNLLDLSRIESGAYKLTPVPVEVGKIVESCVEVESYKAESFGLKLTSDVSPDLPAVEADAEALRRVIRGLIDNAIKNTPDCGSVVISARLVDQLVTINVQDNGRGIATAELPRIFEKFYRASSIPLQAGAIESADSYGATNVPGVGLGLYLAKHIIQQLGGEIAVESRVGETTTFSIMLPVVDGRGQRNDEIKDGVEAVITN